MSDQDFEVGPAADLPPGVVVGVRQYAVGNAAGDYFAVNRHCRHLGADLADGSIDGDGCLVCPWHGSTYDVETGHMVRGPGGFFGKIPGLGTALIFLTSTVLPLGRADVVDDHGTLFVRERS
jgi:nitrite reductase/ring-hydroxylating ferredoxin subunit